jgi:hypothetical protein
LNFDVVFKKIDMERGSILKKIAAERWFTTEEILEILNDFEALGFVKSIRPPLITSNGSIYIFDRSQTRHFKADGVDWIRKSKDQSQIREDFVKINLHGVHRVTGSYTHANNDSTHKRRCYRDRIAGATIHLVHYRHVMDQTQKPMGLMSRSVKNQKEPGFTIDQSGQSTYKANEYFKPVTSIIDFSPNFDVVRGGTKVLIFLSLPLSEENMADHIQVTFGTNSTPAEILSSTALRCHAPPGSVAKVWLYLTTASGRVLCDNSEESFEYFAGDKNEKIAPNGSHTDTVTDIESNLDFTTDVGLSPSAALSFVKEQGDESVDYSLDDPSVLKQSHSSSMESEAIDETCSIESTSMRRKRLSYHSYNSYSDISSIPDMGMGQGQGDFASEEEAMDEVTRQNKVRLVERLGHLNDEWLDDGSLSTLRANELSSLMEKYVMSVVKQLVEAVDVDKELIQEINELDHHGFNLLHYCCLFNQTGLLPVLLARGINTNKATLQGSMPLHLAANQGSIAVVQILIQHGAFLFAQDAQGRYPLQVASQSGHMDIHAYLRAQGRTNQFCPPDYGTEDDEVLLHLSKGDWLSHEPVEMICDEQSNGFAKYQTESKSRLG